MIWSLVASTFSRAPRRIVLQAFAIAFPVAVLTATLGFIDATVQHMTQVALSPVQIEMRGLATSTSVPLDRVERKIEGVSGVTRIDRFASAAVFARRPGGTPVAVRLFAVDPSYISAHPWVRLVRGRLTSGVLQTDSTLRTRTLGGTSSLEILATTRSQPLRFPVDGEVDLRAASTWFQVPAGQVQGDVAVVPHALVVSYPTFQRLILPALRRTNAVVTNLGLTDLPPLDLELHITIAHRSYPSDPQAAATFSERLRRQLEDRGAGAIQVTDDAAEALTLAVGDATNAKVMFMLLGIPGVVVAAILGLVASALLSEAYRRERALLELRGATPTQIARLNAAVGGLSGVCGIVIGLVLARLTVFLVVGPKAVQAIPMDRAVITLGLGVIAGLLVVAAGVVPEWRRARQSDELAAERALLQHQTRPGWLNPRLEAIFLPVGGMILLLSGLQGNFNHSILEDQTQALIQSLYVLIAPLLLWLGIAMLTVRFAGNRLTRLALVDRGPLPGWAGAGLRWFARRPARAMTATLLGVLAVAAGAEVITFAATYRTAVNREALTSFGSDLRLTPLPDHVASRPPSIPSLKSTTPIRYVGARASNGDRKSLLVVDVATYGRTSAVTPDVFAGSGPNALSSPSALLASRELAVRFALKVGDSVTLGLFPDDPQRSETRTFRVAGIYRLMAPSNPYAEAAVGVSAFQPRVLPPASFYMARLATGMSPFSARSTIPWSRYGFSATTLRQIPAQDRRSLASLSLDGLGTIEGATAVLAATLGIGILGTFVVLERAREFAALRAIGIEVRRLVLHPAIEMGIVALGSVGLGVPLGIGLAGIATQMMPLFFILPPPLVTVPVVPLAALVLSVVVCAMLLAAGALAVAVRSEPSKLLRG